MSLNEEVEILKKIPLFQNFEPAKLKLLAFASERIRFDAGQTVCRQGDPGDAAYVIISGEADILVDGPDGPIQVATVRDHGFIGEIAILIDVPRTATIRAHTELVALQIKKDLFFRMVREYPGVAVEVMRELAQRLERTTSELTRVRAELNRLTAK
ncbi:MAG: cyclic nucleotide-binding domain-containing protein [Alphaproteobacteria bacterium]|nr:cyclic nucleotide-binding domain-containing protein [Alphaproteobacteria bacterium]MDX5368601.1 cyclic nucleotide-binding domain-containing protein [Alphaproteobacteria bacterium]MDX5463346.1 cyclic nucleotide-binding domain-containing protein [Alphaproteobacteria bacterium]